MHQLHHLIIQPEHFHNCMMAQHSDCHISFQKTFCTAIKILNNIFVLPCNSLKIFLKDELTMDGWRKGVLSSAETLLELLRQGDGWGKEKWIYTYIYIQAVSWVLLCFTHKYTLLCLQNHKGYLWYMYCKNNLNNLKGGGERERVRVKLSRERESTQICFFLILHMVCKQHCYHWSMIAL